MAANDNVNATADDEKALENSNNEHKDENNKKEEDPLANVDPRKTTPQQQRVLMKRVGSKTLQKGELWYPLSKKWYISWIRYTCFREEDDDVPGGVENLGNGDIPRPGPIDNSDLVDENDKTQLKNGICASIERKWVHSEEWDLLQSWYGGGPALPRKVYRGYRNEEYICIWPKMVKIYKITKNNPKLEENKFEMIEFGHDYSIKSIAIHVCIFVVIRTLFVLF